MGTQSKLEQVGFAKRKEDFTDKESKKNREYSKDSQLAKSTPDQALGKGTGHGGHDHIAKNRLDVENGGGMYDIKGYPGRDGGRDFLQQISTYSKQNQYGIDSIDTEANQEEGQFYIK